MSATNSNPGIIWVPYIIKQLPPTIISGAFNPSTGLKSRYTIIFSKNHIRIRKIKNILKEKTLD